MKIIIKKTGEEETYRNITITHTFKVNGKEVNVYSYDKQDQYTDNYEADQEVDENDLEALTDEEHEVFGENLDEWLDLKVGEKKIEEYDEVIN